MGNEKRNKGRARDKQEKEIILYSISTGFLTVQLKCWSAESLWQQYLGLYSCHESEITSNKFWIWNALKRELYLFFSRLYRKLSNGCFTASPPDSSSTPADVLQLDMWKILSPQRQKVDICGTACLMELVNITQWTGLQNSSDRTSCAALVPVVLRFHKWPLILDYHSVYWHEARITSFIYAPNVVCYLEEITQI